MAKNSKKQQGTSTFIRVMCIILAVLIVGTTIAAAIFS